MTQTPLSPADELDRLRAEIPNLRVAADDLERHWRRLAGGVSQPSMVAWIKNASGEYCYVSERFCELLGRMPDELLWHTDFELLPTLVALQAKKSEDTMLENAGPAEFIESLITADGATIPKRVIRFLTAGPSNQVFIGAIALPCSDTQ